MEQYNSGPIKVPLSTGRNDSEGFLCESATSIISLRCIGGKQYIVKKLRPEYLSSAYFRGLFQKEYDLGSSLSSPYIVRYKQLVDNEREVYIVMEYIAGMTLAEKVEKDAAYFSSKENLSKWFFQLLDGVEYLHERHLIHLDLKPENLMLTQVANDLKIIDLGFCYSDEYAHTAGFSKGFDAPEQRKGKVANLDERTDIYAIGCLLTYLEEVCDMKLPWAYRAVRKRCRKYNKEKRFSSVAEIRKAISFYKWIKRSVCCFVLLAGMLLVGVLSYQYSQKGTSDSLVTYNRHVYEIHDSDQTTCELVSGNHNQSVMTEPSILVGKKKYTVIAVADSAYKDSVEIRSLFLPENIQRIGDAAFEQCIYLTTVNIPNTVTEIGKAAFRRCVSLSSVRLPNTIKKIDQLTFGTCFALQQIVIPEGVTTLGLDAFIECMNLRDITLPSTLTTIARGVFWACLSLESIHIPASVTSIGEYAFFHCPRLRDIYVHATNPPVISQIFNAPVTVHVPVSAEAAYRNDMAWGGMDIVADIPDVPVLSPEK